MRTVTKFVLCAALCVSAASTTAIGQGTQQAPAPRPVVIVPLKVDVTLSRYQNDKLLGRAPFTLVVNPIQFGNNPPRTSLRVGVDVPAGTESTTIDGKTTTKPYYRNVGTQIDSSARLTEDGRYLLELSVQDSAVFAASGQDQQVVRANLDVEAAEMNVKRITDAFQKGQANQSSLDQATIELKRAQSGLAQAKTAALPASRSDMAFRNFSISNQLTLKDGQSTQFTAATDKISGEVLKVEVAILTIK
jgi:hypothetical protein